MLRLMKNLTSFVLMLFLGWNSAHAITAEQDLPFQLLNAFGPGCVGAQTADVAVAVKSLRNTLDELKNDPACPGTLGALSSLDQVTEILADLKRNYNSNDLKVTGLENQRKEITLLMSNTTDPAVMDQLQALLIQTRTDLALNYGYREREETERREQHRLQALSNIVKSTNMALSGLAASRACWSKYPALAQGAADVGSAVSEALNFGAQSNWIAGLVTAGLQLGAQVIDAIFKGGMNDQISRMSSELNTVAFSCVYQTLAQKYCNARDVQLTMELIDEARPEPYGKSESLSALRLLTREVPNLMGWLKIVEAGTPVSNKGTANDRNLIDSLQVVLKTNRNTIQGDFSSVNDEYLSQSTVDAKIQIVINWLIDIRSKTYPCTPGTAGCGSSPYSDSIRDANEFIYNLIGVAVPATERSTDTGSVKPIENWKELRSTLLKLNVTPTVINAAFEKESDKIQLQLDVKRSLKIYEDEQMIFQKAKSLSQSENELQVSPLSSMEIIVKFLKSYQPDPKQDPALLDLYNDTIERLTKIQTYTLNALTKKTYSDSLKGISALDAANLRNGTSFLSNRLNFIVRLIVEEIIFSPTKIGKNGRTVTRTLEERKQDLRLLAANDIHETLKAYMQQYDPAAILQDSADAKVLVMDTIENFNKSFGEKIGETLDKITEKIKRSVKQEGVPNKDRQRQLASFCLSMIGSPIWEEDMQLEKCLGTQVPRSYKNGPLPIAFTKQTYGLPIEERLCAYADFKRKERLYGKMKISRVVESSPSTGSSSTNSTISVEPKTRKQGNNASLLENRQDIEIESVRFAPELKTLNPIPIHPEHALDPSK